MRSRIVRKPKFGPGFESSFERSYDDRESLESGHLRSEVVRRARRRKILASWDQCRPFGLDQSARRAQELRKRSDYESDSLYLQAFQEKQNREGNS